MAKGLGSKLISVVALSLFGLSLIATGYYFVRYQGFQNKIEVLKESEAKAIQKLDDFKSQEQIYPKIRAFELVQQAESQRIQWSSVLEDILKYQGFNLKFNSFSSDKNKLITIRGWARRMEDVARFLEDLKQDPKIENPFISTVAESGSEQDVGYSFGLTFFYKILDQ